MFVKFKEDNGGELYVDPTTVTAVKVVDTHVTLFHNNTQHRVRELPAQVFEKLGMKPEGQKVENKGK